MADQPPARPPDRFQVKAGFQDGQPFIEIVDNLAVTGITVDIPTALLLASGINQAAAHFLIAAQQEALHRQHGIVVARPVGKL